MKPATVGEIIKELSKFDPNLPCYFRPKYSGDVSYTQNVPVNKNGIGEMEPINCNPSDDYLRHVCFLC